MHLGSGDEPLAQLVACKVSKLVPEFNSFWLLTERACYKFNMSGCPVITGILDDHTSVTVIIIFK